jgi:hypothetical protein
MLLYDKSIISKTHWWTLTFPMKWPRELPQTQVHQDSLISFVQNRCLHLQEQPDDDDDNADEFDRHWSERDMAAYGNKGRELRDPFALSVFIF